ncbi:hypothetical protein BDZ45DRAFT_221590 [Acephala macrosclerotiorum]|nr:hypothetical protein BDZ45DRAFT_221590 [Acephala macrosclerotiorum]
MDWVSCEQEVVRLYVDEAKTIHETLEYLHEKHGIIVTPKQFKSRFGGLKNLRADEWKVVIRKIRKRQDQGKASDVYLNGRKLNPERVMREIRRYSKDCNDENPAENGSSIDLGVDSPNSHRIEIRTPTSPKVNQPLQRNLNVSHRPIKNLEARPSQDVDPFTNPMHVGLVVPIPELDLDFMDLDFSTPRIPAKYPRYSIPDSLCLLNSDHPSTQHSSSVSLPLNATQASTTKTMLSCRSQPSLPFRSRAPISNSSTTLVSSPALCGISGWQDSPLTFFWDLPDISSFIPVAGTTSTLILENGLRTMNWSQKYKRTPRGTKGWLLSHLVGVDRKLEALQLVADFVEKLLLYFPATADMDTQILFNGASQQSLCQMFAIVAYLASNNILKNSQMQNFLIRVSNMGFLGQLSRFLQMESANVRAFRASLLRASANTTPFQTIQHRDALRFLLSLDHRICSGRLGGELLHKIASSNNTEDARLLIFHGADIDFVQDLKYPSHSLGTPLCRAILSNAYDMAKYLISAGCDVNKRFRVKAHDGEETALTIAIQKQRLVICISKVIALWSLRR